MPHFCLTSFWSLSFCLLHHKGYLENICTTILAAFWLLKRFQNPRNVSCDFYWQIGRILLCLYCWNNQHSSVAWLALWCIKLFVLPGNTGQCSRKRQIKDMCICQSSFAYIEVPCESIYRARKTE